MAVLWILEKPGKQADAIAARLQGDYAVRCFASMESLSCLTKLSNSVKPDMMLVDCDDYPNWNYKQMRQDFAELLPTSLRVYIASAYQTEDFLPKEFGVARRSAAELAFFVHSLLTERSGTTTQLSERRELVSNLLGTAFFDYHGLSLTDTLSGESIALSFKEAKILRLMIEHSSQCVSREIIMAKVWPKLRVSPRTIDSHISRLRKRIEPIGLMIESQYGSGYILRSGQAND